MSLINAWIVPDFDIVLDWLAASSIYRTMCSECTCMYMWRKKQRRQIHCKYIFFPKINTNHTFVSQNIICYCLVVGNIWPIWRSSFEWLKLCNAQHKGRNVLDGETIPTRIAHDGDRKGTTTKKTVRYSCPPTECQPDKISPDRMPWLSSLRCYKQVFRPIFSHMSTDLDKICQVSVDAWTTLVGSISPRSVHGRLQAKRWESFDVTPNLT